MANGTFTDKVIVVTGAGSGLGNALMHGALARGAHVVAVCRTVDNLRSSSEASHGDISRLTTLRCDLVVEADVDRVFDQIHGKFGRVDTLINNAGIGLFGPSESFALADAHRLFDVNFFAAIKCMQRAVPLMTARGGDIVNVISTAGKVVRRNEGIYAASKWALLAASEAMRMELDAHDIRILAYLPGGMVTKFWQTPSGRQHQPDTSSFMYPTEVADYLLTILDAPRSLYPQEILVRRGKKR